MRQPFKEYLVILFIAGALALNYPVLALFDRAWMPFGIPLLYLYIYLAWLIIIVLLIVVVERAEERESEPPVPPAVTPDDKTESSPRKPA